MYEITIFIETSRGNEIKIKVLNTDTILDVKKKFIEAGGSVYSTKFKFDGSILQDNQTIEELEIEDNDKITSFEITRGG